MRLNHEVYCSAKIWTPLWPVAHASLQIKVAEDIWKGQLNKDPGGFLVVMALWEGKVWACSRGWCRCASGNLCWNSGCRREGIVERCGERLWNIHVSELWLALPPFFHSKTVYFTLALKKKSSTVKVSFIIFVGFLRRLNHGHRRLPLTFGKELSAYKIIHFRHKRCLHIAYPPQQGRFYGYQTKRRRGLWNKLFSFSLYRYTCWVVYEFLHIQYICVKRSGLPL